MSSGVADQTLTNSPASVSPWKAKLKRITVYTGASLAALAAAYGVGRFQTSNAIDAADQKTAEIARARTATEQTLAEERNTIKKLEARRHMHLAMLSLDKRNFGIAQEHLDHAARLLAGHAAGELENIRAGLAATKLLATEDLETQRTKLLDATKRFDGALPPRTAP